MATGYSNKKANKSWRYRGSDYFREISYRLVRVLDKVPITAH
jgi:hypothetical protein